MQRAPLPPLSLAVHAAARLGAPAPRALLTSGLVNVVALLADGSVLRVAAERVTPSEWEWGMIVPALLNTELLSADLLSTDPLAGIRAPRPLTPLEQARRERACVWEGLGSPLAPTPEHWESLGRQLHHLHHFGPALLARASASNALAGVSVLRSIEDISDVVTGTRLLLEQGLITSTESALLASWLPLCASPGSALTLVHGDAWPKNTFALATGVMALLDWDEVGLAPHHWDLAIILAAHARALISDAALSAFELGYGQTLQCSTEVERMLLILELRATVRALGSNMQRPQWLQGRLDLLASLRPERGCPEVAELHAPEAPITLPRPRPALDAETLVDVVTVNSTPTGAPPA